MMTHSLSPVCRKRITQNIRKETQTRDKDKEKITHQNIIQYMRIIQANHQNKIQFIGIEKDSRIKNQTTQKKSK